MNLIIPSQFESILKKDSKLYSSTLFAIANISEILNEESLYFFEEYTNHGYRHVQSVLDSCQDIIESNTIDSLLSPIEISLLINSVLLHDIGMHTTLAMFNQLLSGSYNDVMVSYFDEKTWSTLWEDYLDEAKKFSISQKKQIFGDEYVIVKTPNLDDKNSLNTLDRKLIGEFIRRHHPRFAHEISLKGAIIGDKDNIPLLFGTEYYYKDFAGLIARSHGMEVRKTFDYLKKNHSEYEWANPYSIKIVYLMIILRIADYFQFDSNRISIESLKLKTFSTPFSEYEHKKHLSIKFIKPYQNDDETLIVETAPKDSSMFISLTMLLNDIQKELDISWAALGEIYGRASDDKRPKIKFRRIKSNLDDRRGTYVRSLNYVPEEIKFTSDVELLKLLVAPLYGSNPIYGVRELLQNSVDACRERKMQDKKKGIGYDPIINVSLIKNGLKFHFVIDDNGKGMTLYEIKNYFLKAGSSLRKSDSWKRTYSDANGKSLIARSGKFGIGVLAGFLLGAKIEVETRSQEDIDAYRFSTNIDTNQIEIKKTKKDNTGTCITIEIDENIYNTLDQKNSHETKWFEWFTLKTPVVIYNKWVDGELLRLNKSKSFPPDNDDKDFPTWNKIFPEGFQSLFWTYDSNVFIGTGKLTCNGIVIPRSNLPEGGTYTFIKNVPKISIFDFDGLLNLSLNRNSLNSNPELSKQILFDIYSDIIAKMLCFNFGSMSNIEKLVNGNVPLKPYYFDHSGLRTPNYNYRKNIGFTKNGYFINDYNFVKYLSHERVIEVILKRESDLSFLPSNNCIVPIISSGQKLSSMQKDLNIATESDMKNTAKVFLPKVAYEKLLVNISKERRKHFEFDSLIDNDWASFRLAFDDKSELDFENFKPIIDEIKMIKENKFNIQTIKEDTVLADVIDKYLAKDVVIPYSIQERKRKYSLAFDELAKHINKY